MRVDSSKPPGEVSNSHKLLGFNGRSREHYGQKARHLIPSCEDERDECKRTANEASKLPERASKPGSFSALGAAWRTPTYWLCGVRCKDGVTLLRALVQNLRTRLAMVREETSGGAVRSKVPRRGP